MTRITFCLILCCLRVAGQTETRPLYIIQTEDGDSVYEIRAGDDNSLSALDPVWINSIEVVKGEDATRRYSDRGKAGAVIITIGREYQDRLTTNVLRAFNADPQRAAIFIFQNERGTQIPLKDVPEVKLDDLQAEWIQEITVLKDKVAKSKYGDEGRDGVVIITIGTRHIEKLPALLRQKLAE